MKSYAVVKKKVPIKNTILHTFKIPQSQRNISIDSIEQNRSNEIRRDSGDKPSHLIETKVNHFKVGSISKDLNRTDGSLRRNKIFSPRKSSLSKQKMSRVSNSVEESIKNEQQDRSTQPILDFLVSTDLDSQERKQLKSASLPQQSPQKQKQPKIENSPIVQLNQSMYKSQPNRSSYQRVHKIFQKRPIYVTTSPPINSTPPFLRGSQPSYQSYPPQPVETMEPIQEQNFVYSSQITPKPTPSHSANILPAYEPPKSHASLRQPSQHQRSVYADTESSASVINIGCCGEDLENESRNFRKRKVNQRNQPNTTIVHKQLDITQSISENYVPQSQRPQSQRPYHRAIFNEFNPQLVSRKIKSNLNGNDDKINSRPVRDTDEPILNTKKYKVTIFQIAPLEPFEF